jgi:uncharacterized damage-inducible protein DinB
MKFGTEFERLLAYDRWANGRVIASLEALEAPPAKGVELLGHLLGAQAAWISRVLAGREPDDWEAWDAMDLPALRRAWSERIPGDWGRFLADGARSEFARTFSYVNYLGESRTARVEDVAVGLLLHSAYHRGQIATAVRGAGGKPAVTDYFVAVREGALG